MNERECGRERERAGGSRDRLSARCWGQGCGREGWKGLRRDLQRFTRWRYEFPTETSLMFLQEMEIKAGIAFWSSLVTVLCHLDEAHYGPRVSVGVKCRILPGRNLGEWVSRKT